MEAQNAKFTEFLKRIEDGTLQQGEYADINRYGTLQISTRFGALTASDVQALCRAVFGKTNITGLSFWDSNLGSRGIAALAEGFRHLPTLQHLNLSWNNIGPEEVTTLAAGFAHLPNLQYLNLGFNNLGPRGMAALAAGFIHLPKLQTLDFGWTFLGPEGIAALATGMSHLHNLQFWDANLGPQDFEHLK